MINEEQKKHLITTILGWMFDIGERVGELAWAITGAHRDAIDFINNMDENTLYSEYHEMSRYLISSHAIARNDIYDTSMCITKLNEHGGVQDEDFSVTREERDIRAMLNQWPIQED